MSGQNIIYDAVTMPVVDHSMLFVAVFGAVGFSTVSVICWRKSGKALVRDSGKNVLEIMRFAGIQAFIVLALIGYLTYSIIQTIIWRYDYIQHHYEILEGCVTQFSEHMEPDRDLGTDDFMLQGHPFRLSDSGWRTGYNVSHHHGSPIREGARLSVFAHGDNLLRIELLPNPCPTSGA
jgi:hypothetical protein